MLDKCEIETHEGKSSTCLGAGPAGMCTILEVTSIILLLPGASDPDVLFFSGQRWSLIPEQGARFVTNMKWPLPSDP